MPTPRSIRLVRVPATASTLSASTPREKWTVQADPNPSASAATTSPTMSCGRIGVPSTSPPAPIEIRSPAASPRPPARGQVPPGQADGPGSSADGEPGRPPPATGTRPGGLAARRAYRVLADAGQVAPRGLAAAAGPAIAAGPAVAAGLVP